MKTSLIVASAVAAAISVGVVANASAADNEKCYGIAKAGKNDCQTATHSCAGTSTPTASATRGCTSRPGPATTSSAAATKPKA